MKPINGLKSFIFALILMPIMSLSQAQDTIGWDNSDTATFDYWVASLGLPVGGGSQDISVNTTFTSIGEKREIYSLPISQNISSINISGSVELAGEKSLIRVLLLDVSGNEYLIYETNSLIVTQNSYLINRVCEETCLLNSTKPQSLQIELIDASLRIETVSILEAPAPQARAQAISVEDNQKQIKKGQNDVRINAINSEIKRQGLKWVAAETPVSLAFYSQKKGLFSGIPGSNIVNLRGAEYYKGGIFEIPSDGSFRATAFASGSSLTDHFDWRERHGTNWNTGIKSQISSDGKLYCNSCWAMAALGATEALVNTYYNRHDNVNLSIQDLVSCSGNGIGCTTGGYPSNALNFIIKNGVVNEDCFADATSEQPCSKECSIPTERIKIGSTQEFSYPKTVDKLQQMLIDHGPLSSAITSWSHAMTLVGYDADPDDGKVIWIFKNSAGEKWGSNGYGYVKVDVGQIFYTYALFTPESVIKPREISCVDNDKDGYNNWGISVIKPTSCPASAFSEKDCDDSNDGLGAMNSDGSCQVLGNANHYLLVANQKATVDLRFSNENGEFRPAIAIGNYAGTTTSTNTSVNAASNYAEMAIADFDGDGQMDFIAATNENPSRLYLYKRTGPNAFHSTPLGHLDSDPKAAYWLDDNRGNDPFNAPDYGLGLIAADLNNDGKMDFIETINKDFNSTSSLTNYWIAKGNAYINDGSGNFTKVPNAFDFSSIQSGWALGISSTLADINGDGFPDMIASEQASGGPVSSKVYLLKGSGNGTFGAPTYVFTNRYPATYMTLGDFNNDGMTDAIVGMDDDGDPGAGFFFKGRGNGAFEPDGQKAFDANIAADSGTDQPGWGNFRAYDADSDGKLDIIAGAGLKPPVVGEPPAAELLFFHGLGDGKFDVRQQIDPKNPLETNPAVTILYPTAFTTPAFIAPPKLSALLTGKTGTQNARIWTIKLSNNGPGTASNAQINGLDLAKTFGAACTPIITSPASFPLAVGDIAPKSSASGLVTINFGGCPSLARFTATIKFGSNNVFVTGSTILNNQFR